MPSDQVVADAVGALNRATSPAQACQGALDALAHHTDANGAVLLSMHQYLRTIAASGAWMVYAKLTPGRGVVGRVFESGLTAVVTDVTKNPDYIPLRAGVEVEICSAIRDNDGTSIGAIDLEFPKSVPVDLWRERIDAIAAEIGRRVVELGVPGESSNEKLVRHGLKLTTAATEEELAAYSLYAAKDVSGLDSPVLVLTRPNGYEVLIDEQSPSPLARRVAALPIEYLVSLITSSHEHGASYSLGDPAEHNAAGYEELTSIGVRSLLIVPLGAESPTGGVLLVADERATRPDPELTSLIGLLAAQAWSSRDRLRMLAYLQERALSDPLTGLRHQGSFGERLARAAPDRTAVFVIDIDGFKTINDTFGHQAGDRALVALAQALSTALRSQDELFRIGGDEFGAIVEVHRAEEAVGVAERLVIAARAVGHTISVGVAIRRSGETAEETLRRADDALYLAKREGRDGVRLSS